MPDNDFRLLDQYGNVIAHGATAAAAFAPLPDSKVRVEAAAELARIRSDTASLQIDAIAARSAVNAHRNRLLHSFCDGIETLTHRLDTLEAKRARAAADAEARRVEDQLAAMPDPDDPDSGAATHSPGGELHALQPSNLGDKQQLAAGHDAALPGDPSPPAALRDNEGDLPNELTRQVPPPTGNYLEPDPDKLAHPETPKVRSPAAISLNEA